MTRVTRKSRHKAHSTESGVIEALPYIRVSSDEQEREGLSLPAQLAACRRYAAEKGWLIGEEYQDVLSGKRDDRPEYQRLLTDVRRQCAEGRRVIVVVKWLDRLGRRVLERVRSREELKELGVPVHTVMEGGEVSDLVANVLASVAEEEARRLGERVSEVIAHVVENGWHPAGRVPWGYRLRPATEGERHQGAPRSVLVVAEAEAPFVQEAFRRVASGESIRSVARWAAALPDQARSGRSLSHGALRFSLRAPVYVARPSDGDSDVLRRPLGRWPALVDDATWRRVQETVNQHKQQPRQASNRYLLTGLLRCDREGCGARMTGHERGSIGRGARYVCSAPLLGANSAGGRCWRTVLVSALDTQIRAWASEVLALALSTDSRHQAALRKAWRELQRPTYTSDIAREIKRHEAMHAVATRRLRAAGTKLVDGELPKKQYDLLTAEYERDLASAEAELARLRAAAGKVEHELPALDVVLEEVGGWTQALTDTDIARQRGILALLIETVSPIDEGPSKWGATVRPTTLGDALERAASLVRSAAA